MKHTCTVLAGLLIAGILFASPLWAGSDTITATFTAATTNGTLLTCASTKYLKIYSIEAVVTGGGSSVGYVHTEGTRSTTNTLTRVALSSNLPLVKYFADKITEKGIGLQVDLSAITALSTVVFTIEYQEF